MERKRISLSKLILDKNNPNFMTDEQKALLNHSIDNYGQLQDVIVNLKDGIYYVVDGHQKIETLKKRGEIECDVRVLEGLSDSECAKLQQMLNKARGQHDLELDKVKLDLFKDDLEFLELLSSVDENMTALLNESFKKEDFSKLVDEFSDNKKTCEKNENWFYVEFYKDRSKFDNISSKAVFKGKSNHELDGDWFYGVFERGVK